MLFRSQASYVESTGSDKFQFDSEAWFDTDDDGLTDYIDPNSTIVAYTTVQLCSNTPWYTMSSYPSPATGDYLAVSASDVDSNGDGEEDAECTFTLPAGETLDVVLQTGSYGGEAIVHITDPSGTITAYSGYSSGSSNTLGTFTTAGSYTIYYGDTWGDGCNPSTFYGACFVQASYTYISGTTVPSITTYGTSVDLDDDGDGYSDLDEGDAYDTATTALCDDGSVYASSSDSLDASSTPADMDDDLTCDALDPDRDGDGYANSADDFPDDVNEWIDTDADGTGDNADTDDDADGTPDVDDAFPLDVCADTDSDADGKPDTMTAGCSSTLVLDSDDDGDGYYDIVDAFALDDTEWDDTDGDGIGDNTDDDDDGDGVPDSSDAFPLNVCASEDFDGDGMPDDFLSANCGATVATASFELASTGGQYTDTGNQTLNHTLANNAGESDVNYDASTTPCTTGGTISAAFTCSFTLGEGETLMPWTMTSYTYSYNAATLTGPSGHLLISIANGDYYTDWATQYGYTGWSDSIEPGTYTWSQEASPYGLNMMGFTAYVTGSDLGYDASYISTGGVGLTDGDYFGVTSYSSTVGSYTDGSQGYQMSDVDGIAQLAFESVSDADSVSLDIFVQSTGWESADYITISWIGISSSTTILDTNGYDIDIDFAAMEGAWTTVSADVSGTGYLMVEFASNSASEAIFIDNVVVTSDGLDLDLDDDNDGWDDLVDDCPYDDNEHTDTDGDGYCDVQDTDDDNDGTYDWNDEFPLDPNEQVDNDQDGIGDNADDDDDNDGVLDVNDAFPNDATEWSDFDGDGIGDNADTDDDGDNVPDDEDPFPLDGSAWIDTDGDGIPDYTGPPPFSGEDRKSVV